MCVISFQNCQILNIRRLPKFCTRDFLQTLYGYSNQSVFFPSDAQFSMFCCCFTGIGSGPSVETSGVTKTKLTPAGDPPTIASAAAAVATVAGTLGSDGVPILLRFGALPSPPPPPLSPSFLSFPINTVSDRIFLHSSRITRMPTAFPTRVVTPTNALHQFQFKD
jgi:hypothetical protein